MLEVIRPEWPASPRVRALATTRGGGFSSAPYDTLNLGDHVGDDPLNVSKNRERLREAYDLPSDPFWLTQVHGCGVALCGSGDGVEADAAFTDAPGRVCAVLTADCLPVLLCNAAGTRVAAVHAGWRGLAAGVIEAAMERFDEPGDSLLAWLGPAIGPDAFEVGPEVREQFLKQDPECEGAFRPGRNDRWMADIYELARIRLGRFNPAFIGGGDYCTVTDETRFYSYRRDGVTGRMATLIWIDP
jgi:YfiH family protein